MTAPGQVMAFGPLDLASWGIAAWLTEASDTPTLEPTFEGRYDAEAVYVASTVAEQALAIQFTGIDTYEKRLQVLRALDYPRTASEKRVLAYKGNPADPVLCQNDVTVASIQSTAGGIVAIVTAGSALWSAYDLDVVGPITISDTAGVAIQTGGQAVTYGTYKIGWSSNRAAGTSTLGVKYARFYTITNGGDRDWHDRPVCVDLGDTAAWVTASKAQADGDDVRVRANGWEYARTLVNFNTKRSFVWFLLTLKAGESIDMEFVYGNPNMGTPANLSTYTGTDNTYVAFDLEGVSGTASSGTSSALTDNTKAMESNRWRGGYIQIVAGTGTGQMRKILSNTAVTFNVTRNWSTSPDNTSVYVVWGSGIAVDGGSVSAKTADTMTDSSQSWGVNQWKGATVTFLGGSPADPNPVVVASNTADTLTFTGSFTTQPNVGNSYRIQRYGVHRYNVSTSVYDAQHTGLWRQNRYYDKPSRVWIHSMLTPGGWVPRLYLDNGDDFAQSRTFNLGASTSPTHAANYRGMLRARRSLSQDRTYPDEGQADGVSIYAPEGYNSIYFNYKLKNENGVGKFVLAVLEAGGESWRNVITNSTSYASLTAGTQTAQWRDLGSDNTPVQLYMGVLPVDGEDMAGIIAEDSDVTSSTGTTVTDSTKAWETNIWAGGRINFSSDSTAVPKSQSIASNTGTVITVSGAGFSVQPTAGDPYHIERNVAITDEIEVRGHERLELYIDIACHPDLANSVYTVGAETEVYDLNVRLRLYGGEESIAQPPFDRIVIGGSNGHWLHLATGEELWISTDPSDDRPLFAVYNSGTLVYECAWAGQIFRHELDNHGNEIELLSRAFMPISNFGDLITNGSFTSDFAHWTDQEDEVGVTATWSRDAGTYHGAAGSGKCVIGASPVGDWFTWVKSDPFSVVLGQTYDIAVWVRTTDVALLPNLYLEQVNTALYSSAFTAGAMTLDATGTWYALGVQFEAEDTDYRLYLAVEGNGSHTGTVYFDEVTVGAPVLYLAESAMGTLTAQVEWRDRYLE